MAGAAHFDLCPERIEQIARLAREIDKDLRAVEHILIRVVDGICDGVGIKIVFRGGLRGGVADEIHVRTGNFGVTHEVDVQFGFFFVLGRCRDAHGIDKVVRALFRDDKLDVFVIFDKRTGIAGIVRCKPRFAAFHFVKNLVHDVRLYEGLLLL